MENQELRLRAEFRTGVTYVFYGNTKKNCLEQFKQKCGSKKGYKLEYSVI